MYSLNIHISIIERACWTIGPSTLKEDGMSQIRIHMEILDKVNLNLCVNNSQLNLAIVTTHMKPCEFHLRLAFLWQGRRVTYLIVWSYNLYDLVYWTVKCSIIYYSRSHNVWQFWNSLQHAWFRIMTEMY